MFNHAEVSEGHRFCPNCGSPMSFAAVMETCECGGSRCSECRCTKLTAGQVEELDKKAGLFKRRGLDAIPDTDL